MHPLTRQLLALALAWPLAQSAAGPTAPLTPNPYTAILSLKADGSLVVVSLRGAAAGLVGFARAPDSAGERDTLALAAENLRAGDALIRFNTQAGCRLEQARVDADPTPKGKGMADLGADYRFRCDRPDRLDSAALGLFMGFPALDRVHVHYDLAGVRGEGVATAGHPVVSFVPLR